MDNTIDTPLVNTNNRLTHPTRRHKTVILIFGLNKLYSFGAKDHIVVTKNKIGSSNSKINITERHTMIEKDVMIMKYIWRRLSSCSEAQKE